MSHGIAYLVKSPESLVDEMSIHTLLFLDGSRLCPGSGFAFYDIQPFSLLGQDNVVLWNVESCFSLTARVMVMAGLNDTLY